MSPPFDLVHLIEMDADFLAGRGGGSLEGPRGFVDANGVGEVALNRNIG
jgi:hypothetical protein